MTITVKIAEAKARFSELVAKAEAGEEVVVSRGNTPVIRFNRIVRDRDLTDLMERVRARRAHAKPVTLDEILTWRHEGHRH